MQHPIADSASESFDIAMRSPRAPAETADDIWSAPDMNVLREGRTPPPQLPLHLFGKFVEKQVREIASSKGAPPDYVLAGLLSAAASLIGNARWVEAWSGWREPIALWTCLVGGPSAGKSPAAEPIQRVLAEIEAMRAQGFSIIQREHAAAIETAALSDTAWREAAKAAHDAGEPIPPKPESAIEPEPPARPRAIVMDITTEELAMILKANPKGCLQFRDELSGFLSSHGRYGNDADRPFYLEAYGGRRYTVDRRRNDQPIVIPYLTLSICGGIQPDKLNALLLNGDDDGLSARFLYVWPDPVKPVMPDHEYDLNPLRDAFNKLESLEMTHVDGEASPMAIPLAKPELLLAWIQKIHHRDETASGVFGSFAGKLRGVCVRLAGLIEFLTWAANKDEATPTCVSESSLKAAIEFIETYVLLMAKRVFSDASIPEDERHAALIAHHIKRHSISDFNARKARQEWGLPGMRKASQFDTALSYLEEAGWVRAKASRKGNTKGRRAKNFEVNPALL